MTDRPLAFVLLLSLAVLVLGGICGGGQSAHAQVEGTTPTKSVAIVPPSDQPDLKVTSEFQDPSGNDTLDATETGTLAVTVTNQGGGPAREVKVLLESKTATQEVRIADSSLQETPITIGTVSSLSASTSKTFSVPIRAEKILSGTTLQFGVDVREKYGFVPEAPHTFAVNTETYRPPSLELAGFDVKKSSKQKLRPDTTQTVSLRIENSGKHLARQLKAQVQVVKGGGLPQYAGSDINLGTLKPDSSTSFEVKLAANPNVESVAVRAALRSADDPFKATEKITLPVVVPDRPPLVDRKIPTTPTKRKNAIAVVVGVRNYQNASVPNVDYAKRDAKIMKKYLVKTLGFRKGNVLELINPTKAGMQSVFGTNQTHKGDLYDYLRTDSTEVFVYYTGHGAPNPEENGRTYFLPSNGNPRQLSITGYPVDQLYENLSKLTSGPVTVAIDACFSGQSGGGGTLIKNASPAMLSVENPMVGMKNGMVMTASKASQISSWYPEMKHGLFTYFLLKGFRGEADQNRDSLLTGLEMKSYLQDNVSYYARRLHSRTQNPQVMGKGADRVLVRYTKDASLKRTSGKKETKKKSSGKKKSSSKEDVSGKKTPEEKTSGDKTSGGGKTSGGTSNGASSDKGQGGTQSGGQRSSSLNSEQGSGLD